jgi:hypothetical protein
VSRCRGPDATGDQQVQQGQRQHEFPAECQQLIVTRPQQGGPKQDEKANDDERLEEKPDNWREERAKSASSTSILLSDTSIWSRILS